MSRTSKLLPAWVAFSVATNGVLILTIAILLWRDRAPGSSVGHANASVAATDVAQSPPSALPSANPSPAAAPDESPTDNRSGDEAQNLDYEDWVDILAREAEAIAANPPERLYILAGDSISLWFPNDRLPAGATWLNQGISGEGAEGLYRRLPALDETRPDKIFVMIGINDLLRGVDDETLLENHRKIVKDILWIHPDTEVVVQSILPHSGEDATWEGREKLLDLPNARIRRINRRLKAIAEVEGANYLDLYPLFADDAGKLRREFSTDGLHLNDRGYDIWRTALMVYDSQNDADAEVR